MAQIVLGPNRAYPSLPTVGNDLQSHSRVLEAIIENIQIHERRTKDVLDSFVRVRELMDLGLLDLDGGIVTDDGADTDASTSHNHDTLYIRLDGASPATTGLIEFGAGIDVIGSLRVIDSGDTDIADFSHDGTDFLTTFTNTVDWVIDGLTGTVLFDDQTITVSWDVGGTDTVLIELVDGSGDPTPPADPNYGDVIFLASFEGATLGAEAFSPEIGPDMNWSIVSGTEPTQVDGDISSAQAKFGSHSLYWKESAGVPNAGWATDSKVAGTLFGFSGDFTIEFHVYIVSNGGTEFMGLWDFGERQWLIDIDSSQRLNFNFSTNGSNTSSGISQAVWSTSGIPTGAWHHIAICRSGSSWYAFLDGVLHDTGPATNANTIHQPTDAYFVLGQTGYQDGTGAVEAYMDNIRITDGTARYTSNFTAPTAPYFGSDVESIAFTLGDSSIDTAIDGLELTVTAPSVFEDNVTIENGSTLRVYDSSDADYVDINHDGTDANFNVVNTTAINFQHGGVDKFEINSVSQRVWVHDGWIFRVSDSTDLDYAEFSHNGTDFNVAYTNTGDVVYSGEDRSIWSSGGEFKFQINHSQSRIAIRDGYSLRILDSIDADYGDFSHDGTNFTCLFNQTSNVDFVGVTDNVRIRDGAGLVIYDAADADYAQFIHDGTDFTMSFVNTTEFNINDVGRVFIQANGGLSLQFRTDVSGLAIIRPNNDTSKDFLFSSGGDYWQSDVNLRVAGGSLFVNEIAAAAGDNAGAGQIWVENLTPNVLKFTDDAGSDFDVAVSSATTGGSGSAGAGNQYVEISIGGVTYKVLHDGTV